MNLHLGCGKRYIPGFIHVDLVDLPHIDYQHNIKDLPMFQDNSAKMIYACHVLEYFDLQEATSVLTEWRRVLQPGGILRLAVPDFPALMKVYEITQDLNKILGPLYGRWVVASEGGTQQVIYHKTVYDFDALKHILQQNGFADIHRYDWRQTVHKDYDDYSQAYYPHMDKDNGLLISLNVESVKM